MDWPLEQILSGLERYVDTAVDDVVRAATTECKVAAGAGSLSHDRGSDGDSSGTQLDELAASAPAELRKALTDPNVSTASKLRLIEAVLDILYGPGGAA